jgi:hypothetical protein
MEKYFVFYKAIKFLYSFFWGVHCGIFENSWPVVARLLDHTYELTNCVT